MTHHALCSTARQQRYQPRRAECRVERSAGEQSRVEPGQACLHRMQRLRFPTFKCITSLGGGKCSINRQAAGPEQSLQEENNVPYVNSGVISLGLLSALRALPARASAPPRPAPPPRVPAAASHRDPSRPDPHLKSRLAFMERIN